MAAYIFDIDGTIVNYHTSEWLEGAKEMLINLYNEGNDIIFITMRCKARDEGTQWSIDNTHKLLSELNIKYRILFNVQSPRFIFDDSKVKATRRVRNEKWDKKV